MDYNEIVEFNGECMDLFQRPFVDLDRGSIVALIGAARRPTNLALSSLSPPRVPIESDIG